eukprot:TRINITY_DN8897_c0_g1_i2.p1 TRINITY_DN8897_c0_g1~~TRINITY_DN8897_c0_g1_i2.p1  ORF type:complete len:116 (-),score=4.26 TRINITY_DN8897_c0_g1_i2:33-380(-)
MCPTSFTFSFVRIEVVDVVFVFCKINSFHFLNACLSSLCSDSFDVDLTFSCSKIDIKCGSFQSAFHFAHFFIFGCISSFLSQYFFLFFTQSSIRFLKLCFSTLCFLCSIFNWVVS